MLQADLIVSSPFGGEGKRGVAYIIWGSSSIPAANSAVSYIDVTDATSFAEYGVVINGDTDFRLGWSSASVGDINGDGETSLTKLGGG